ncbi:MAG: hypothetical protein KAI43_02345 [Candidatus Aureabacteria bacterium]|nr:hypothetical protein [Candidatus Auribacterota bacterium]
MPRIYIITIIALFISFLTNRKKTIQALQIALKKFSAIMPAFLTMLILISIVIFIFPDKVIIKYLGHSSHGYSTILAAFLGSITLMPGFITFPLCNILLEKGVSYMVLSAFSTTLMMVGIMTFPIEKAYLGTKVTIIRNIISFCIALCVAFITGIFFGEIF